MSDPSNTIHPAYYSSLTVKSATCKNESTRPSLTVTPALRRSGGVRSVLITPVNIIAAAAAPERIIKVPTFQLLTSGSFVYNNSLRAQPFRHSAGPTFLASGVNKIFYEVPPIRGNVGVVCRQHTRSRRDRTPHLLSTDKRARSRSQSVFCPIDIPKLNPAIERNAFDALITFPLPATVPVTSRGCFITSSRYTRPSSRHAEAQAARRSARLGSGRRRGPQISRSRRAKSSHFDIAELRIQYERSLSAPTCDC
ncbi:hypothetical protein EVAR_42447_1 [Eumeta japonica]|uniref:Uncharacterized protein n=1 Tax=Eumeta variegata TaxID=151549 RepID=A0A4C1XY24_EUMVA|nr:hypothetical protein EVAR_42447_1 [Eumeta japonica]